LTSIGRVVSSNGGGGIKWVDGAMLEDQANGRSAVLEEAALVAFAAGAERPASVAVRLAQRVDEPQKRRERTGHALVFLASDLAVERDEQTCVARELEDGFDASGRGFFRDVG
jgi:hypothetical protein